MQLVHAEDLVDQAVDGGIIGRSRRDSRLIPPRSRPTDRVHLNVRLASVAHGTNRIVMDTNLVLQWMPGCSIVKNVYV